MATANTPAEDLDALFDCLNDKPPQYTVVSSKCATGAVCWNWVFFGGQSDLAEDPSWAYMYVQPNSRINKLLSSDVTKLLDDAKKEITGFPPHRIPERKEKAAHELILHALLEYYSITVQDDSPLKLLFYYKKGKGIMYHHVEFEYRKAITITKGNNEDLKAFNGISVLTMPNENFEETYGKIIFGININTLKAGHFICIKDLRVQAEAMS